MEDALASIPPKYAADFRAIIENPLFLEQPDTRNQMVIATRIQDSLGNPHRERPMSRDD
jgi:hypothetical protein